jgi:hypothetical protein
MLGLLGPNLSRITRLHWRNFVRSSTFPGETLASPYESLLTTSDHVYNPFDMCKPAS